MRLATWNAAAVGLVVICAGLQPQLVAAAEASSIERDARFGITFEADLEYGGDDIATVSFTDGSRQDVKAGQGFTFAVGGLYKPAASSPFGIRATAGYKFVTTAASDADIGIDRMVFELLGSYRLPANFWFGLGLTHHSGIEFDGDGLGPNLGFDDATGVTAEFGWKWLALSYTSIDYTDEFGSDWDAGSVGLTLTTKF